MPPTTSFIIRKPHKKSRLQCSCRFRPARAICERAASAPRKETDPDRLEFHVAERTRELARANAESIAEVRERRLVEQALRDSEARYRAVVEQAREVICTTDAHGNWTFLNPAWTQITGFDVEESLGESFLRYVYEEDRAHQIASFQPMVTGEQDYFCQEVRYLTRDGGICWIEARCQRTTDIEGNLVGFSGTLNDISERKQAEAQLQHQTLHDTLTGLPNRLLFQDRLRGALKRAQRSHCGLAVLFVDLDNFKVVNDSMGHEAGDALLMTIASRLQSSGREEDTIARLGGDEFTLLLENLADAQDAIDVAERIVTQLQQPIPLDDREVFASASIGIVYSDAIACPAGRPDARRGYGHVPRQSAGQIRVCPLRPQHEQGGDGAHGDRDRPAPGAGAGGAARPLSASIDLQTGRHLWHGGACTLAASHAGPDAAGNLYSYR